MNDATIGRNYAEALRSLASKSGDVEEWGELLDAIATAMREDQTLRTFLESPKLAAAQKIEILRDRVALVVRRLIHPKRAAEALHDGADVALLVEIDLQQFDVDDDFRFRHRVPRADR